MIPTNDQFFIPLDTLARLELGGGLAVVGEVGKVAKLDAWRKPGAVRYLIAEDGRTFGPIQLKGIDS